MPAATNKVRDGPVQNCVTDGLEENVFLEKHITPTRTEDLLVSTKRKWVFNRQPAVSATHPYCLTTYF